MLIDADVMLFLPPPLLFASRSYERHGHLLFRDQRTRTRNSRPDGTKMTRLRTLLLKLWAGLQAGADPVMVGGVGGKKKMQLDMSRSQGQSRGAGGHSKSIAPPNDLMETPLWRGSSYDTGESSVVLWHKSMLAQPTRRLEQLHRPAIADGLYQQIFGDKEVHGTLSF